MAKFGFRNDAQLNKYRAMAATALPDTCSVADPTVTGTASGGKTTTYGTPRTYNCRVESKLVRQLTTGSGAVSGKATGGRLEMVEKVTIYVPYNADVKQASKITHTQTGYVYRVVAVSHDSAWPIIYPVVVERVFGSGE